MQGLWKLASQALSQKTTEGRAPPRGGRKARKTGGPGSRASPTVRRGCRRGASRGLKSAAARAPDHIQRPRQSAESVGELVTSTNSLEGKKPPGLGERKDHAGKESDTVCSTAQRHNTANAEDMGARLQCKCDRRWGTGHGRAREGRGQEGAEPRLPQWAVVSVASAEDRAAAHACYSHAWMES